MRRHAKNEIEASTRRNVKKVSADLDRGRISKKAIRAAGMRANADSMTKERERSDVATKTSRLAKRAFSFVKQ